jgi:hypothetical protein
MKKIIDYTTREIVFYKFICNDPSIISTYAGHTVDFTNRKRQHKGDCVNETSKKYNRLIYKTIRDNGGWDNWTMFEIERKIVDSKQDALKHEQYLIDLQLEKLNMNNAIQHSQYHTNYRTQNIIKKIEYEKNYRKQNNIKIKEYYKNRYDANKNQIALQNKEYRVKNKEKLLLRCKKFHEQNKELINFKHRERYHKKRETNLMSLEDKY